jgi:hypothetical protein
MYKWFLDSATKDKGRFLFWSWELWEIGGGAGVEWKFLKWSIYPSQYNPLWQIFEIQRNKRRKVL